MSYSVCDTNRQNRILRYMKVLRQINNSKIALFYRNTEKVNKNDLHVFKNLYMEKDSHFIYQKFSKYQINNFLKTLEYQELIHKQSVLVTHLGKFSHSDKTLDEYDQLKEVNKLDILPKELNNIVMKFL